MKIFNRENTIDRLENKQKALIAAREERKSKIDFKNARLYSKQKRLEDKMYINREKLDKFNEKIDLELDRNAKLIIAEAEYAKQLGTKYNRITKKTKINKK